MGFRLIFRHFSRLGPVGHEALVTCHCCQHCQGRCCRGFLGPRLRLPLIAHKNNLIFRLRLMGLLVCCVSICVCVSFCADSAVISLITPAMSMTAPFLVLCLAAVQVASAEDLCPVIGSYLPSFCSASSDCSVIKCPYVQVGNAGSTYKVQVASTVASSKHDDPHWVNLFCACHSVGQVYWQCRRSTDDVYEVTNHSSVTES